MKSLSIEVFRSDFGSVFWDFDLRVKGFELKLIASKPKKSQKSPTKQLTLTGKLPLLYNHTGNQVQFINYWESGRLYNPLKNRLTSDMTVFLYLLLWPKVLIRL